MTTVLALLFRLESLGAQLKAEGESIRVRAPDGVLPGEPRELIRDHKVELLRMLKARERFGYQGAALFPLIGRRVVTRQGPGTLLSVFRSCCRVELEMPGEPVVLYRPADLISAAVDQLTEKLAA